MLEYILKHAGPQHPLAREVKSEALHIVMFNPPSACLSPIEHP